MLQAEQLLRDYEDHYIKEKMSLVEASKPFKEQKIQNLSAYLSSALRYNYQLPQLKPQGRSNTLHHVDLMMLEPAQLEKQVEKIHREYAKYRERSIEAAMSELNHEMKQQMMNAFFLHAEDTIQIILKLQRKKYNRNNILESPQVKALLRKFALKELPAVNLKSLEEFVLTLDDKQKISWQQMRSLHPDHVLMVYKEI
jgi:hypothetical protein